MQKCALFGRFPNICSFFSKKTIWNNPQNRDCKTVKVIFLGSGSGIREPDRLLKWWVYLRTLVSQSELLIDWWNNFLQVMVVWRWNGTARCYPWSDRSEFFVQLLWLSSVSSKISMNEVFRSRMTHIFIKLLILNC